MRTCRLFILLLLSSAFLFSGGTCMASQLEQSLNRYKNVAVSNQEMKRLSQYNRFINHFSQFTFFRKNHKVSPNFIRALILAESSANPLAVSPKGAMGLGQIIYTTGRQAAKELSKSNFQFRYITRQKLASLQKTDLFDPAINILLTCYLISKYNYKFNGRLELVISAWNAGEYHKELNKGQPVPYPETYNLIGKVNGYYIDLLRKDRKIAAHRRR